MSRPIVITGGGTGGHIFPMLAIAEQLQELGVKKSDIRYVGSRRGQEKDLLRGDIRLTLLPGRGLRSVNTLTLTSVQNLNHERNHAKHVLVHTETTRSTSDAPHRYYWRWNRWAHFSDARYC